LTIAQGIIQFDNAKLSYRQGLPLVLKGINCIIESKAKIGVVGRTGAGKSSLMSAILRICSTDTIQNPGAILIDGVDISTVPLSVLRSRISVIPQEPVLFSGTLRYNLDPFNTYSNEQLWESLDRVHISTQFKANKISLNSMVAEYGSNFSQGEKQLICVARALLRNNKIVLCDEATASIDVQTDKLIQQTIRESFSEMTVITVAHRINTILDSDKILVLDKGRIIEYDTPNNLMNIPGGLFSELVKADSSNN